MEHENLTVRIALALERIVALLERESATAVAAVQPEALCREDAAKFLGVLPETIDQLVRTRKLAYVQHGEQRGRVFCVEALRKFLKEYRQATGDELVKGRRRA